jgi:endogenous inhibitor of DNA gyrase (YacG/DUF329 family)
MTDTAPRKRCPICGKPADAKFSPFCGRRCADVDLHRWLSGSYALSASDTEEADDADVHRAESDETGVHGTQSIARREN